MNCPNCGNPVSTDVTVIIYLDENGDFTDYEHHEYRLSGNECEPCQMIFSEDAGEWQSIPQVAADIKSRKETK